MIAEVFWGIRFSALPISAVLSIVCLVTLCRARPLVKSSPPVPYLLAVSCCQLAMAVLSLTMAVISKVYAPDPHDDCKHQEPYPGLVLLYIESVVSTSCELVTPSLS